jgi:hypothetical protein
MTTRTPLERRIRRNALLLAALAVGVYVAYLVVQLQS